mmetsp:Transcript_4161/g.10284  ORF Transcript_4161/g.10284 Transcript_4161/m.10284 type:complete len:93 (-) Transcript_4161:71-349(-)
MEKRLVEERARGGDKEDGVDGGMAERKGNEGEEESDEEESTRRPARRLMTRHLERDCSTSGKNWLRTLRGVRTVIVDRAQAAQRVFLKSRKK